LFILQPAIVEFMAIERIENEHDLHSRVSFAAFQISNQVSADTRLVRKRCDGQSGILSQL
jgi:hypothetical protein